jgi:hypothetical protein
MTKKEELFLSIWLLIKAIVLCFEKDDFQKYDKYLNHLLSLLRPNKGTIELRILWFIVQHHHNLEIAGSHLYCVPIVRRNCHKISIPMIYASIYNRGIILQKMDKPLKSFKNPTIGAIMYWWLSLAECQTLEEFMMYLDPEKFAQKIIQNDSYVMKNIAAHLFYVCHNYSNSAAYSLAKCFWEGEGVLKNRDKALKIHHKLSDKGYLYSIIFLLAYYFENRMA